MSDIFTTHIRSAADGTLPDAAVLVALESALKRELRRGGLLDLPPYLLGYVGGSWHDEEPMNDLVGDCYIFAIVSRLRGLRAQLKVKYNIDGYVFLNVKNFVTERQRQFDRIGYALFQNLKGALDELVASMVANIQSSDSDQIDNSTVFVIPGESSPPATEEDVRDAFTANGVLFESIECLLRVGVRAQEVLVDAIRDLMQRGVKVFTMKSLIAAVRSLVDESRVTVRNLSDYSCEKNFGEIDESIRITRPTAGYENQESFENRIHLMNEAIDRLPRSKAVRDRLKKMLDLFADSVRNNDETGHTTVARMAEKLRIAPSTLHDSILVLREVAARLDKSV